MEKITHRGNIIEVVQTEVAVGGRMKTFEFARRAPGTRIIVKKDEAVLLTKEFRRERNAYDHRLPGGKVYDSLEEYNAALASGIDILAAAESAAAREAREEAGIVPKKLAFLHKSVCGATVVWDLFYFLVTDFETARQQPEEGEDISFAFYPPDEVRRMCLDGTIGEERSALVLLRLLDARRA